MSDASDQSSTPPLTNPAGGTSMTGGGPLPWNPPAVAHVARLFPNYEILELVGRRGKGAVYKARQVSLDRVVGIKLLPLDLSANQEFKERFAREARTMAKLNHPNILAVHDFGVTSEGHPFFVMEFTGGASLRSVIDKVGLEPAQALYVAGEICEALSYAHGNGVIHRNIKPANVMVNRDSQVKVAEFGLAQIMEADPEKRGTPGKEKVVGTLDYMAPEQKRGSKVDHRADIYSLGVVLYEMLCREVPQGAFELPSRRTKCDERVDAIVRKAMQPAPERRYQSTREMKADLETVGLARPGPPGEDALAAMKKVGPGVSADTPREAASRRSPAPAASAAKRTKGRTPLFAGIAAVLIAAIGVGIAVHHSKPKTVAERIQLEKAAPGKLTASVPIAQTVPNSPEAARAAETRDGARVPPMAEMKTGPVPIAAVSPPPPAPGDSPQQSESAKWLAEQEPQWRAAFALEVDAAFDNAVAGLKKKNLGALAAGLTASTRAGNLEEAVAWRDELQRMDASGVPAADDAATPSAIKAMRDTYRKDFTALESDRESRARAVHARYDALLAQKILVLTQQLHFDDALVVRARREALAAEWLKTPTPTAQVVSSSAGNAPPKGPKKAPPAKVASTHVPEPAKAPPATSAPATNAGNSRTAEASKDQPFENSLGMKFVPVPITGGPSGGQRVLFSIWETRVKDYEPFAKEKKVPWPKPTFPQGPTNPAVNVDVIDARDFCAWLTDHERKAGRLDANERYRLPSDHEWSCAVGIGDRENAAKSPEAKNSGVPDVFPWGNAWPRPPTAGNYKSAEGAAPKAGAGSGDHFPYTAPAGSFPANGFGIFDLGGNVWEWCDDLFNPNHPDVYVTRGGCFVSSDRRDFLSSCRLEREDEADSIFLGFRVVVSGGQ